MAASVELSFSIEEELQACSTSSTTPSSTVSTGFFPWVLVISSSSFRRGKTPNLCWRAVVRADDTISFSASDESASTASRAAFAAIALIYVQVPRAHSPKPNLAPKTTSLCVQVSFGLHSKVSMCVCQHQKNFWIWLFFKKENPSGRWKVLEKPPKIIAFAPRVFIVWSINILLKVCTSRLNIKAENILITDILYNFALEDEVWMKNLWKRCFTPPGRLCQQITFYPKSDTKFYNTISRRRKLIKGFTLWEKLNTIKASRCGWNSITSHVIFLSAGLYLCNL